MTAPRILIIVTSHAQMGESNRKTGLWLEEIAFPYYIFKEEKAVISLVSPRGGETPLDPKSESIIVSNTTTRKFLKDPEAMAILANSIPLNTVNAHDFDLVFLPGGHGPMWDFIGNEALKQLLEDFYGEDKLIGAVSHGQAAFLSLENKLKLPLLQGRQITAFSNTEEAISGLTGFLPFSLESALSGLGAAYSKGPDFQSHVVRDGNFITGQNAASAKEVAKQLMIAMKSRQKTTQASVY